MVSSSLDDNLYERIYLIIINLIYCTTGKGYNELKDVLPKNIEIACHNSANSCTLSGPTEDVEKYVKQLQEQKVFAKAVNVANIAYHSKHIAPAAPNLLSRLKKVKHNIRYLVYISNWNFDLFRR